MTPLLLLLLPLAAAQAAPAPKQPAADLFMHTERAPGVELRFVDYHWQPAIFEGMEKGTSDEPQATRNWVVARLVLQTRPMTVEGKRLGVGNYGIGLWPSEGGQGMTLEIRQVDMRDVFPSINAIAPLPKGETVYRGPARFERGGPVSERMNIALAESGDTVTVTLRYGDRRLVLALTR